MKICVSCRKEMSCVQNGVAFHFGGGHAYVGDIYQCHKCGAKFAHTNSNPVYLPEPMEYKNLRGENILVEMQ